MANTVNFSISEMKKLQEKLNKIKEHNTQAFIDSCAKELAARLLADAIKRTPVGDYSKEIEKTAKRNSKHHKKGDIYTERVNPSGKKGGRLRRGWISESHEEAASGKGTPTAEQAKAYADSLEIKREGNMLVIEIINPVKYASYVEFGHKQTVGRYVPELGKKLKQGWVEGKHMLTDAEKDIQNIAPKVLESKIKMFLEDCFK